MTMEMVKAMATDVYTIVVWSPSVSVVNSVTEVEKEGVLYQGQYNVFIDTSKSNWEIKNAEGSNNDSQEVDSWVSKHIHWKDKEEYNTYN